MPRLTRPVAALLLVGLLLGGVVLVARNLLGSGVPSAGSGSGDQHVHAWQFYHEQDATGTESWCFSSAGGTVLPPFIARDLPASPLPTRAPSHLLPTTTGGPP